MSGIVAVGDKEGERMEDMRNSLPIGIDSFRKIREEGRYYVDKTLMIKDFIQHGDEVALITRPRRFGKTLNMTMLREFFDITADSRAIFDGLAIMDTEYAEHINSLPVIYLSFKNCKADTADSMLFDVGDVIRTEYAKYHPHLEGKAD
ncbi:MAG: AAA family ATPase, partial [Oscillospiraceae bacterium]|nr:AAA family ATPase [Oscillospiraceae bacterium]